MPMPHAPTPSHAAPTPSWLPSSWVYLKSSSVLPLQLSSLLLQTSVVGRWSPSQPTHVPDFASNAVAQSNGSLGI